METNLAYFDETGDDGISQYSCDHFVLTSLYMPAASWQKNFDGCRSLRQKLRKDFGLHIKEEFHTKQFLTDKNPYRDFHWTQQEKRDILLLYANTLAALDIQCVNVVIDKTKVRSANYFVLENALSYNIQRIDNDSGGKWNYIAITDKGRVGVMRQITRKIRVFNPIPSMFGADQRNLPIRAMVEDILEKDSKDSYFIQSCDFISYFVHLYFVAHHQGKALPNRVLNVIDADFVDNVLNILKDGGKLNLRASHSHPLGIVIYPK